MQEVEAQVRLGFAFISGDGAVRMRARAVFLWAWGVNAWRNATFMKC
jgi:hypothetical protein